MKLGYGTYGMKALDIFDVLPRLRAIGYDAVEIAAGEGWPTAPENLDTAARERLVAALGEHGFPPPVLLALMSPCARGDAREAMRERFVETCRLAADLNSGDAPTVVTSTLGGNQPDWDTGREAIAADLVELADLGAEHNVIFAIEPHVGGALDTPEKAAWLMGHTGHDHLRLNFDYSHFVVQGMDLDHCVRLCAPHAVHTHIKDGTMTDGKVTFLLPGAGGMDLVAYMRSVAAAGLDVPITVEVSGMIWNAPDYDPWQAADFCYRALDAARRTAAG